ncbi:MAG: type II secretion system secretin GspD [Burkholderiales bacterium]|nr:MAG: type II secretion system secretin GspD [Burkholderiales bacterium]
MSLSERLRPAPGHCIVTAAPQRRVGFTKICIAASAAAFAAASQPVAAQQAAQDVPAARTSSIGHSPALKSKTPVTLNFVNAEVDAVSRAMGAMLERQIVVDPRVKGTITLFSEQPLSVREAYLNYLAALRGLGFTVVESAGLLKVVPEADAKLQTGTVTIGNVSSQRGDQILTQVFRLNHENVNSLVPVLRPLISPNNTINANPGNNSLVITDYADNLRRIGRIIAALDVPSSGDVEVIPLEHAVAADLAPLVQRLAEGASPVPGVPAGAAAGTATTILVEPRSNALLVRAANPARLASIRALVAKLDQPAAGGAAGGSNIWVVPLRNADAVKLATVLRAAFGSGAGAGGSPTSTVAAAPVTTAAGAQGASPQAAAPVTPGAGPSTGGFVQADPSTNSLIITAPEPLYRQVRAMIDQLDSRRAQVYIESMIVEVQGDNAADFGFQWQGLLGNKGDKNILGAGTNFGTTGNIIQINKGAATGDIVLGEGLNIGLVHNFSGVYALASIARFLQSQANTNIVSTPNLITLDNEEAKIIVGSNVPFVTGQYTNTGTGTTSPFQTIERKDVGITLRIRPQIGEGGTVRMTIFQEASSLSSQVAPGTSNAGPSTNKRSIESTVVVDDGGILVLGGLIEDRYIDNNAKVPGLGDIPGVGGLFRSESRTRTRTNLMVFLRPVIMRDSESANRLSLDRYDLIRANQQAVQPKPSVVLPINEGPVAPPIEPAGSAPAPAAAVPTPVAPTPVPAN